MGRYCGRTLNSPNTEPRAGDVGKIAHRLGLLRSDRHLSTFEEPSLGCNDGKGRREA